MAKEQLLLAQKPRTAAQKQRMLANIQNQVIQGSKTLGSKRNNKHKDLAIMEGVSRKGTTEKKKNGGETSKRVDLMKASLLTDIRIETASKQ